MIKLKRGQKPSHLTDAYVAQKTADFKAQGTRVWDDQNIKKALLKSSNDKCAFCECKIDEESKYLEVEHFKYKKQHPDDVLEWENLLPSCKRCNGKKHTHDVVLEPIINPFIDNPATHIKLHYYRLKYKTTKGKITISTLGLNDTRKVTRKRFEVGEQLQRNLDMIQDRLESYKENPITRRKNKLVGCMHDTLQEAMPCEAYSATVATVLHNDSEYEEIKKELIRLELWSVELQNMDRISSDLVLN
ncbi:MAG: HNH endonuclease [Candidatus Promineifilaceae bacterium]